MLGKVYPAFFPPGFEGEEEVFGEGQVVLDTGGKDPLDRYLLSISA